MIIIGVIIFAWLIVSQMIAWAITEIKDQDAVLENWALVFLAPIIILIVICEILNSYLMREIRYVLELFI